MDLPVALHTAAGVRALEARALATPGTGGPELMRRAATAALEVLRARWPEARRLVVLCGGGDNGGDGWMLARLALEAGLAPRVLWTAPPGALRGEAAAAADSAIRAGVPASAFDPAAAEHDAAAAVGVLAEADVIVDALLGIGLDSPVRAPVTAAIAAIDAARRPVLALDLPSGLCADSGRVLGAAVHADVTVTFIALKAGLWLGAGPDHAGTVRLATLGVVDDLGPPAWLRLDRAQARAAIPPRGRATHKGQAGHVLVVGGGVGMPGAARLAGESALRVGAGRVTVVCASESATAIAAGRPELMVRGLPVEPMEASMQLRRMLTDADVLLVGPGLGRDAWARALLDVALGAMMPTVIDADALHLMGAAHAARSGDARDPAAQALRIHTPHPGEAGRLLGMDAAQVQADRPAALVALLDRLDGIVVLKAAGTLVGRRGAAPLVCGYGDPVLAAPGTGDVLAGAIAGLLAQTGASSPEPSAASWGAVCAAVWLHARAGERLANAAHRGVLAGEVAAELPATMSELLGDDGSRR